MNQYCDECAELLTIAFYPIESLKVDISSANAGESATICPNCYEAYKSRALLTVVLETGSPSSTEIP